MFLTNPNSEMQFPKVFRNSEQMWPWVKFGINAPYYLVQLTITQKENDCDYKFTENYLVSEISQILDIEEQQTEFLKINQVCVLIPNFMRGSDGYTFGQVSEIWGSEESRALRFVLIDGEKIHGYDEETEPRLRLLFSIQKNVKEVN